MLDAPAFGAFLEIGTDLALEVAVQLTAQEAHHVLGGEGQQGRLPELRPDAQQLAAVLEHDIGGDLGLVDGPVVAAKARLLDQRLGLFHVAESSRCGSDWCSFETAERPVDTAQRRYDRSPGLSACLHGPPSHNHVRIASLVA